MAEATTQAEGRDLSLGQGETVELELELDIILPTKALAEVTWDRREDVLRLRSVSYGHRPEPTREQMEPSIQDLLRRATGSGSENLTLQALGNLPRPPWSCASCGRDTNRLAHSGRPMCPACRQGER